MDEQETVETVGKPSPRAKFFQTFFHIIFISIVIRFLYGTDFFTPSYFLSIFLVAIAVSLLVCWLEGRKQSAEEMSGRESTDDAFRLKPATEDGMDEFSEIIEDRSGRYVLVQSVPGSLHLETCVVYDCLTKSALLIEDDDVALQLNQRMSECGVPMLEKLPK